MAKFASWKPEGGSSWLDPLIARIEAFEEASNVFGDVSDGLADDGPDWVAMCLYRGVTPLRKFVGLDRIKDGIDAKRIGTIVGAKVSLCDGMANAHVVFSMLSPKQSKQIEDAWGSEEWATAQTLWKFFAAEIKPLADDLRRFGSDLVSAQPLEEKIQYSMGFVSGLRFMLELGKVVRRAIKRDRSKRERDAAARGNVILFAVSNWKEIESKRRELTWMGLTERFDRETNHEIPIDEETFKKILQRGALTIGKSYKPMNKGRSRTKPQRGCP